jgi:hypothetical protein
MGQSHTIHRRSDSRDYAKDSDLVESHLVTPHNAQNVPLKMANCPPEGQLVATDVLTGVTSPPQVLPGNSAFSSEHHH